MVQITRLKEHAPYQSIRRHWPDVEPEVLAHGYVLELLQRGRCAAPHHDPAATRNKHERRHLMDEDRMENTRLPPSQMA